MLLMIMSFFYKHKVRGGWDILDDGDDLLLFVSPANLALFEREGVSWFKQCGHELKLENYASCLEEIFFCQSRPIRVSEDRWRMTRDLARTFWGCTATYKHHGSLTALKRWLKAVGIGLHATHPGIPVLQHLGALLYRSAGESRTFSLEQLESRYLEQEGIAHLFTDDYDCTPTEISDRTRISFQLAYGIAPARQRQIEWRLNSILALNLEEPWDLSHLVDWKVTGDSRNIIFL
jgi:hypothetical protein